MASGSREKVLENAKQLVELFTRLHEALTKASSKNESLLEAIESSQARASETNSGEVSVEAGLISTLPYIILLIPLFDRLLSYATSVHVWRPSTRQTRN